MSQAEAEQGAAVRSHRPRKMAILGMGLLFFVILGIVAILLCNFRIEYVTQSILSRQRDTQQTWLDKSLDAIRVWRNELLEQARYISSAELFRLFVIDAKSFTPEELASLSDPDTLHSGDDSIRSMAEQATYIQDLLKDFTMRRAWNDARILLPDGTKLVEPRFSPMLVPQQVELAKEAGRSGRTTFGAIRRGEKGLVMDVADPLFEVLGADDTKPVAILLLSVPMEKPLATFLARHGEQRETLLPRIVNRDGDAFVMVLSAGGEIRLEPVDRGLAKLEALPFGERVALAGGERVYSLGGTLTRPDWLYALETPAAEIAALVHDQKVQIYGLGILSSIGIALLAALIWAALTSRTHEARAKHLEKLYNTISEQKIMLDSMNASVHAGLLLSDQFYRAEICNPAFAKICGKEGEIKAKTPLSQLLPPESCTKLLENLGNVRDSGKFKSVEIAIPLQNGGGERLYRVNIHPYVDGSGRSSSEGTVTIFEDITEFRRRAQIAREREKALISAMGRAIESVDPNLVGHSDKMENVAALLAAQMGMAPREGETLRLAARLSQVGKIFVPREILTKQGKLTPEELAEARRAPEYADKILHDLHFDLPVRETVHMIGERMDGSGKPDGLVAEQIPVTGRALAVINAFIAMTSVRSWRKGNGMDLGDAFEQLKSDPGFDQSIVKALAALPAQELAKAIGQD